MTQEEFAAWQAVTENSRFQWTEDVIFRLNGRGAFYYTGGEDGIYIKIHKDGRLEAGSYEDAFPHIGEASFTVRVDRQCKDYSEAFKVAMEAGGKQFLVDMFSGQPAAPVVQPSVLRQIEEARKAPQRSRNGTPPKLKGKGGQEL